ncbi:hypothetical protein Ahy_A06g029424 isoform A [Arachis hypogaea]|uniref:SWIM-type domain-containing protein n=1 Tax=Arachis hypogaea TaxID=3818 RepID=A0A445CT68_ARAHY|nr:hypothetical protein Ahy_A06g029424 isoform A [Arachis hypogaea]
MNQLKEINRDCYDKLFVLDPKLWTKSHFTFLAKSDMLMNNISEAFNGRILEARDKPILTMFEWIRCYLMTRFAEKKKKAERYEGSVLPKPKKRLDIIAVRAVEWQVKWAGDLKFEVHHKNMMIMERFVVNLMAGRCSCRFWGLCGMPCPHACCAIFEKGDNPKDYCSNYYSKAAYLATYGQSISPINGENIWPKIQCDTIIPSIFRVKPGSNCGQYGHNRRLYPNLIVTDHEGTQGSDVAVGTGGGDAAANEPDAAVEANRSAATPIARSRMVRGRCRGRARVRMGRGRGRGSAAPMTAPTSGPSNTPAPPSQPPQTPTQPSQPTHTPAPPSQPATLPTPTSLSTTLPTPASLPTAPASQLLPKTKIFGVRRSGRLKIGVRKATRKEMNLLFGFFNVLELQRIRVSPQKQRTLLSFCFNHPLFSSSSSSIHSKNLHFGILPQPTYLLPWLATAKEDITATASPQKQRCLILTRVLKLQTPEDD